MLPFRKVLVTTDFSSTSLEAVPVAAELASHFGAGLCLVHVLPVDTPTPWDVPPYADFGLASIPLPEYEGQVRREVEHRLGQVAAKQIPSNVTVETMVARGDAAAEIGRIARERGVDLVVIATHGWTGWRHLVFGSVAERVLREAPCAVLSIRRPAAPPAPRG
jgi:nucleotide-binding universal stress UspA family protein